MDAAIPSDENEELRETERLSEYKNVEVEVSSMRVNEDRDSHSHQWSSRSHKEKKGKLLLKGTSTPVLARKFSDCEFQKI